MWRWQEPQRARRTRSAPRWRWCPRRSRRPAANVKKNWTKQREKERERERGERETNLREYFDSRPGVLPASRERAGGTRGVRRRGRGWEILRSSKKAERSAAQSRRRSAPPRKHIASPRGGSCRYAGAEPTTGGPFGTAGCGWPPPRPQRSPAHGSAPSKSAALASRHCRWAARAQPPPGRRAAGPQRGPCCLWCRET